MSRSFLRPEYSQIKVTVKLKFSSSNMTLLKIPLILSSAIVVHVANTAPHNPSSNEVVHQTFNEWISMKDLKWGLPIFKVLEDLCFLPSSLMKLYPGNFLGCFFGRNRYHYLSHDRSKCTSHCNATNGRFASKNPGHAYYICFPLRHSTCCCRGEHPFVVFSHPWSFFHI